MGKIQNIMFCFELPFWNVDIFKQNVSIGYVESLFQFFQIQIFQIFLFHEHFWCVCVCVCPALGQKQVSKYWNFLGNGNSIFQTALVLSMDHMILSNASKSKISSILQ